MLEYHPLNPLRPTDHRWQLARLLKEKKLPESIAKKTNDEYVLQAWNFQTKLATCKDEVDRWVLMEEFPVIYSAYLIHKRGEDEDRAPLRYMIEARILAGQKDEEIAFVIGTDPAVITWYERIFFDVKEKLKNPDYILGCVMGPSIYSGLSDRDYDLLWKLFGYLYGVHVLESFIQTTSRKFRPENINEVDTALAEDARSALQRKVAVVSRTFAVNPFSQSELLNIYARFIEVERAVGKEKAHDIILQNVQVMLDNLPMTIGSESTDSQEVKSFDSIDADLRSDELLTVAAGKQLENKPEIDSLKFPS